MWHRILTICTLGAETCALSALHELPSLCTPNHSMSGRYCRVTFPNVFAMVGRPVASADHKVE